MYEAFFGMEHTPFVRDVPPEKLYESNAFRETLGRLSYVADRQMFAVVTADPGCGKSTLIRRFYSELPKEDYIVLYLSDSKLTPRWFYKGLLDQLGLESRFYRGVPNASCNRRSRSSGECSTKRSSASLMKLICLKRKHWKNSVFCSTTDLIP